MNTARNSNSLTCRRLLRSFRFAVMSVALSAISIQAVFTSAADPAQLKLITHNVWYGFTKKPEPRHEQWLAWMKERAPDVVSLQELNGYTEASLAADAAAWGHAHSMLLKKDGFPTGITSRFPIEQVARIRDGFHHGLLRCQIKGIWIFVIHFHPSNYEHRIREAALLAAEVEKLPETSPKILLAGDFNGFSPADKARYDGDTELEPFFTRLDAKSSQARNLNNGRVDYGGIAAILAQGFVDLIANQRKPTDPFVGTFPTPLVADEDHGTPRRLDYIFVSPNLVSQIESAAILKDEATDRLSDHTPVTATLRLP